MEYKKEYRNIKFRVVYSMCNHRPQTMTFAAQPHETLLEETDKNLNGKPSTYLVYGRVGPGEQLEVGFKDFTFEMTEDLHTRLGLLYQILKKEYRGVIIKKT